MTRKTVAIILTLAFVALVVFYHDVQGATDTNPQNCLSEYSYQAEELQFIEDLNAYRASYNLPPVTRSWALSEMASWKAAHMAKAQYLAHDDPAPINRTWIQRLTACHVGYVYAGEDMLGDCPQPACSALTIFINSPEHNAILLGEFYTEIGVSYLPTSKDLDFNHLWVVDMADTQQGWYTCANNVTSGIVGKVAIEDINYVVTRYYTSDLTADLTEDGLVRVADIQGATAQYFTYCLKP